MEFLYLILGLILLISGGNWLLKAAVAISLKLNIPKIVIGMTVVSFATSAPELIVSVKSALNGFPDLALGNVVGSNIANLGLVLGITVVLSKIDVQKSFYKTDWPVMMIASGLLFYFLYNDKVIDSYEGVILFSCLILFLIYLLRFQKQAVVDEMPEDDEMLPLYKIALFFTIGGVGLWAGSEFLIKGAVDLAKDFGVSERIIGVTVVSVGTSIPELAASVIAVLKKEKAISLGNLIGSNIFNIFGVLGITAMITPIRLKDIELLDYDIFWMLGISFLILPLVFFPRKLRLDWKDGFILLVLYGIFIFTTIS
ncbi:Inner membrane protein YrbG [Polaribacter huanghezhanensis]|uniref:calcium/sodium antiporter n=1 Tax=Polaribacter huanghezhanensis TaxID=1354726 RepID=UPI00264A1028|nr:calcium/sodium antiporter [Polaribacter huanghezhanensis]WKD86062.1 Inner membrane protein YrbG [Polaribacter huanghezhanensis]